MIKQEILKSLSEKDRDLTHYESGRYLHFFERGAAYRISTDGKFGEFVIPDTFGGGPVINTLGEMGVELTPIKGDITLVRVTNSGSLNKFLNLLGFSYDVLVRLKGLTGHELSSVMSQLGDLSHMK